MDIKKLLLLPTNAYNTIYKPCFIVLAIFSFTT